MKKLLLGVSLLGFISIGALLGADTSYWIEPCTDPETSCVKGDVDLAKWAFEAWEAASNGKLHLVPGNAAANSLLRLMWSSASKGLYGETMPILVNGKPGAQIFVLIQPAPEPLLRDTIVYLTCLHESGHALGLSHTAQFDDIMYSFQYGGDIPEYFNRYRRKLMKREDIRKNSGLSAADRKRLADVLTRDVF